MGITDDVLGLDVPVLLKLDGPAIDMVWRDSYALMNALGCSPVPVAVAITGHAPLMGQRWRFSAIGEWRRRGISKLD